MPEIETAGFNGLDGMADQIQVDEPGLVDAGIADGVPRAGETRVDVEHLRGLVPGIPNQFEFACPEISGGAQETVANVCDGGIVNRLANRRYAEMSAAQFA